MDIPAFTTSAATDMAFLSSRENGSARHALGLSMFIKARAFSRMNKTAVVIASVCFLTVVVWPVIVFWELFPNLDKNGSAIAQTVLSGLAAIFFSLHVTYKQRQSVSEKALRAMTYRGFVDADFLDLASEVREVDLGVPTPSRDADDVE